ncbi:MAG TPA: guanine deaminase [Burkholderiaceae bacterium]|nr:guanine deaminase [Burkholderiaceae bacterium]
MNRIDSMPLALRATLLDFAADPAQAGDAAIRHVEDGLLLVDGGRVLARGDYASLRVQHADVLRGAQAIDLRGCLLTPGFIDTHIHLPQIDVIASPARGLLEWLEQHTFVAEARFGDPAVAAEAATFFLDELARHGTTSAAVYGSVHAVSVEALFTEAERRNVRLIAGKCLMDRNCPENLRDDAEGGVRTSADLAARWHGRGRLSYAITPRFAATSTPRQLELAGELARARPELPIQSHVAETLDEVRWIAELFPDARSYLDVYDRAGLLREKAIYAHCIWLDERDRARLAESGAVAAVCPTSNLFLGSGLFDFAAARAAAMRLALGTDVGGGQSFSMLATMRGAHDVARLKGVALSAAQLWYWATRGAAQALGWQDQVGALEPGMEADFVVLDPRATPLLARRTARAQSVEELLFALLVLGDDRAVRETYVAGLPAKAPTSARVSGGGEERV